ncbi:MAG TPA: type II toxin-antitoxin system VapC family toxin [Thermoanaerobaculia bacterium]|nr:type II toxin-antitoxin system VapC family toxin [Thermoanaerobaculia bacterium]
MPGLVTDTHALLWFLFASPQLSRPALAAMRATIEDGHRLLVPTICLVEVLYLVEKGRLPAEAWDRIHEHLGRPRSGLDLTPLDLGVAWSLQRVPRDQVPDMPDRIIAATALHLGLPLVSSDKNIRDSGAVEVIW